jgi:hypothetical protein
MFTLQSGQIENALRGGGMGETSAKEMVQGLANCQGPLQHRGSMAFAKNPRDNRFLFPGLPPTGGTPQTYVPPSIINRQTIINIPPWQNIPWEPIPYPEQEQWQPIPYPEWPVGQYPWDDTSVVVNGPTYMGDVTTNNIDSRTVNSQNIVNEGDIINRNQFFQGGPVLFEGPVIHNHNVVNRQNVVNNRIVNNDGPVFNNNVTHNRVSHNYDTHNHNTTNNYGETYLTTVHSSGPNEFAGDTYIDGGDVYVDGDTFNVDSTTINLGDETSTTTVNVDGDTFNVDSTTINLGDETSTTTVNVDGDTFNAGNTTINLGDNTTNVTNIDGTTVNLGDTNNTNVTNVAGDTINLGDSNTSTTNVEGDTINLGDSTTTDVTIEGNDITLIGQVFIQPAGGGAGVGPLAGLSVNLLTDVEWDSGTLTLKKKYRTISMIGAQAAEQEDNILTGTSCPTTPVNAAAGNYMDMP